ncbi:MAG: hypothetical protein AAFV69_07855 [Pseudomonadota bacterium]
MTLKQSGLYVGSIAAANAPPSQHARADNGFGHMLGFLVVAILPAAFWTGILNVVVGFFDVSLSMTFLGCFFTSIATFLGVIFAAVARTSTRS